MGQTFVMVCQIKYSAKKLISFDTIITVLKCRGNLGFLKIRDITDMLYSVNLMLTKRYSGSL